MHTEQFQQALQILTDAKDQVVKHLDTPETQNVHIYVVSALNKAINHLSFITGVAVPNAVSTDFPPVTNFMGEELVLKPALEVVVDPTEEERKAFLAKVHNVADSLTLGTLTPAEVLKNSPLPEDQLVIRGVAKMAGIEDYEEAPLTDDFMESVKAALLDNKNAEANQAAIDAQLADGDELIDVVVTQEILDENPDLAENGVKVGDTVKFWKSDLLDAEAAKAAEADAAAAAAATATNTEKTKGKGKGK